MKVLQINTVYGRGSTGKIVAAIQETCQENGIDCLAAFSYYEKDQPHTGRKETEHLQSPGGNIRFGGRGRIPGSACCRAHQGRRSPAGRTKRVLRLQLLPAEGTESRMDRLRCCRSFVSRCLRCCREGIPLSLL